jgi:5-methyltetrahydrofolate--homocysteine methyltransferase
VARQQVENGAQVIDINMDEAMLDSKAAMVRFLKLIAAEPDIARVPIMVDSPSGSVIEAGLRASRARASSTRSRMKEGEAEFLRQAKLVRRYGAAAVVMAFDEQGQADTYARKIEICERAYRMLVSRSASRPKTSSSTPTSSPSPPASRSTTTTRSTSSRPRAGSSRTCRAPRSGGVSNVSSASAATTRCARRSTPCSCTTPSRPGMDMGIVNAGMLGVYDDLEPELRERVEDVVLNRRPDAGRAPGRDRRAAKGARPRTTAPGWRWRELPV